MRYSKLVEARQIYNQGSNVVEYLRKCEDDRLSNDAIIEIAYDLQAGTYTESVIRDKDYWYRYTGELAGWLDDCLSSDDTVMEVGCGECTTLTGIFNHITKGAELYGFDISWSRVKRGQQFLNRYQNQNSKSAHRLVNLFVGEISKMPLARKSLDVVYTAHSLEPNGGREIELLKAIFNVARKKVILFEPYYERASSEAQIRMRQHGYIKGLDKAISEAGGKIERIEKIENISNPLNPTYFFEITPQPSEELNIDVWACPTTGQPLIKQDSVYWCRNAGLIYPIVSDIPVLTPSAAVLASAFGV